MPDVKHHSLTQLDADIAQAKQDLDTARAAANRSANADNILLEHYAEFELNRLLERRHAAAQPLAY